MSHLALSILDLVPVRDGQRSSDAVAASIALARRADEFGFTRYWLGEHHNVPSVASTNPAVLLGVLVGHTERIRLGSGGVMLPSHAPLVIAEQYAALEAAAPDRIDLGIGRAPGSDPIVTALLQPGGHASNVTRLPEHLQQIRAMMSPRGASLQLSGGGQYSVYATPMAGSSPSLWLLGTSEYSARLAARLGLPYVLAHQTSEEHTHRLLDLYRAQFEASDQLRAPRALLTVTLVVADSDADARRLALPQLQHMARLGSGTSLGPMQTVEAAAHTVLTASQSELVDGLLEHLFIGETGAVAERLAEFAARIGVDEVMIGPAAGGSITDPRDRFPARERTLELLAARMWR
ncbi:luciferase family oxidoreductase group 1 [Microbacterium halimionae]|uniref:Luciferase family oxidoreductase group 1 n=1 Tax=Microbacterium halimionae TaxID=1526413 RepID=A0A7W3JQ98_9MICO|nr:MsnO8 family LLM class oxidoreductase [Microbacterium halimionae]MBA8817025.1 luciferase family oxidoreductase group 1 [Microbacterium halimionae]NII94436.1 luciferase family oxidoreductase group 1 [Microbacterium halimionae]